MIHKSMQILVPIMLMGVFAAMASAAVLGPFSDSLGFYETDWGLPPDPCGVTLPKFDGTLGVLTKVTITFRGEIQGMMGVENYSTRSGATTTLNLGPNVTLSRPGGAVLAFSTPSASETDTFESYDGVIDWDGLSGVTHDNVDACDVVVEVLLAPFSAADQALFVGGPGETLWLPVMAQGAGAVTGGGSLLALFKTEAYYYSAILAQESII